MPARMVETGASMLAGRWHLEGGGFMEGRAPTENGIKGIVSQLSDLSPQPKCQHIEELG
jgi:hypothetical protein